MKAAPPHMICGMNEWMLCFFFMQRWGKKKEDMYKWPHVAPGRSKRQRGQAVGLDDEKEGKSTRTPCSHAARLTCGNWPPKHTQYSKTYCPDLASPVLRQHSDSRCLWVLTLNTENGIDFSSFSLVGVHYFHLITTPSVWGTVSQCSSMEYQHHKTGHVGRVPSHQTDLNQRLTLCKSKETLPSFIPQINSKNATILWKMLASWKRNRQGVVGPQKTGKLTILLNREYS